MGWCSDALILENDLHNTQTKLDFYRPAPVVKTVVSEPAVVAAPAPVVAPVAPVRAPVVAKVAKPVTYTHLGAHPIHPTTVLEESTQVLY